ncbi:HupE/UreJ family protein [Paenibacillus chartarius]|uniref:HupE/UreJ family protein n=1 Tax=Paenibacillus chartarius TaxID=747481 RepID=A0ABV6DN34_9BACL
MTYIARQGPRRLGGLRHAAAVLAILCMMLAAGGTASAHFSSTGYSDLTVGEKSLQYKLYLLEKELLEALPIIDRNGDGKLSEQELKGAAEPLNELVNDRLVVTGNGKVADGELAAAMHAEKAKMTMIELDIRYAFSVPVQRYMVQYNMYDGTNADHRSFATIRIGEQTIVQVINSSNNIIQIEGVKGGAAASSGTGAGAGQAAEASSGPTPAAAADAPWTVIFREYAVMGMKHIWSGPDHMLFVVGLLLAAGAIGWPTLKLVTAFTVGHSITLVLSALNLASMSPVLVEPLIALSIIYIAVERWIVKEPAGNRQLGVTAAFGMVHGFGFAEILHGTMAGGIALPLFSFNLGVELGQIAVLLVAIPILLGLRRITMRPAWTYAASGIIGAMGLYWLVERVIF